MALNVGMGIAEGGAIYGAPVPGYVILPDGERRLCLTHQGCPRGHRTQREIYRCEYRQGRRRATEERIQEALRLTPMAGGPCRDEDEDSAWD